MWGSFAQAFSKACRSRRDRRSPPQRRNNLILPKRHRRVNAEQCSAEGNRTSGGFPFLSKQFIIVCPLFSLMQEAQRKKLGKKEHAAKGVSRLRARPTLRALDLRSLFEKSDTKTSRQTTLNSPINQNLKLKSDLTVKITKADNRFQQPTICF